MPSVNILRNSDPSRIHQVGMPSVDILINLKPSRRHQVLKCYQSISWRIQTLKQAPCGNTISWYLESLPSNSVAQIRFPAGSKILISVLGLGVCPLPVFCLVLSLAMALTICWSQISGRPSIVLIQSLCSPYRHLTHGNLDCKSSGVKTYIGEGKKRKEINIS